MASALRAQPHAAMPPRLAARRLTLSAFRNYRSLRLDVDAASCVLTGPNGAGKTNLLEALSLLAPGRGLRRAPLRDLHNRAGGSFAVHGVFEVTDTTVAIGTAADPESGKRVIHVDGVVQTGPTALVGLTGAVWLTPPMDRLFTDATSSRRRLLDRLVVAGDPAYARTLARYEHLVRERANLLRLGNTDAVWLNTLEEDAAGAGVAVAAARLEVVADLNHRLAEARTAFPRARLAVRGDVEDDLEQRPALAVEEAFQARLKENRGVDAVVGGARHGPHRSDLEVVDVELASPAAQVSTGRQKALLVGLVLAEARLFLDRNGRLPLLLLDEVGAHLDARRRDELAIELVDLDAQAWLTGTDVEPFAALRGHAQFLQVGQAEVVPNG